jgi:transcriptional regulator with XRE-family HTH domain
VGTFADDFRAARIAAGLNATEAASRLGVQAPRIHEWETGRRTPRPERQSLLLAQLRAGTAAVPAQHIAAPAPPNPGKASDVLAFPSEEARRFYVLGRLHAAREHHGREGAELEAALAALTAPTAAPAPLAFPDAADVEALADDAAAQARGRERRGGRAANER